jgi:tetratricopeptide (TPR) repeat protein
VEIAPSDHAAWVFRGVVLIHLNRYEEALSSCDKALEIAPEDKEAWTFRGAALHGLGRYKETYASYDKALGNPKTPLWRKLIQKWVMGNRE